MTSPLVTFCQSLAIIPVISACFKRIEEYCSSDPVLSNENDEAKASGPPPSIGDLPSQAPLVAFKSATVAKSETADFKLEITDLQIQRGITMVIGTVGSGKSTFLEVLLGEHIPSSGSVTPIISRAAYCPQKPWVMNATIRENITGISAFDQEWYDFVTSACGIEDVQIPGWDARLTGSKGIALSGGQKQRLVSFTTAYPERQNI